MKRNRILQHLIIPCNCVVNDVSSIKTSSLTACATYYVLTLGGGGGEGVSPSLSWYWYEYHLLYLGTGVGVPSFFWYLRWCAIYFFLVIGWTLHTLCCYWAGVATTREITLQTIIIFCAIFAQNQLGYKSLLALLGNVSLKNSFCNHVDITREI